MYADDRLMPAMHKFTETGILLVDAKGDLPGRDHSCADVVMKEGSIEVR